MDVLQSDERPEVELLPVEGVGELEGGEKTITAVVALGFSRDRAHDDTAILLVEAVPVAQHTAQLRAGHLQESPETQLDARKLAVAGALDVESPMGATQIARDHGVWRERDGVLGVAVLGPTGLIDVLELQLGLTGPRVVNAAVTN